MTRGAEEQAEQPPRHATPSFLGLLPHLRRRIYRYTGVARFDGWRDTYYLDGRKESRSFTSTLSPPSSHDFAGLLRTCRALHAEAAALLYSANRFVIFYSRQGSLEPLRALSPTALASLTSLKIVLNESSCHEPVDSFFYPPACCCDGPEDQPWGRRYQCARYHSTLHSRPLLSSTPGLDLTSTKLVAQALLHEWHDTALYLSSRIRCGYLSLALVCDLDSEHDYTLEAARLVIEPLALFPPLKECYIRLCKKRNRPLQQVAESAVLGSRPNTSPINLKPARNISPVLITLPPELRVRILEYTDLVTPWKEVTWSRRFRGYQVVRPPCRFQHERECPPHIHNGCRLSHCRCDEDTQEPEHGCFCRRRHAAFSLECNCWTPPTDLFLICHTLRRDAEFVFFSANRFVVHDMGVTEPWVLPESERDNYYPSERLAVSELLKEIVPTHCLTHLRFLELVFPPYEPYGWPSDDHAAVLDWRATVDWVRGKINAPALTIRFVMADVRLLSGDVSSRQTLTEDEGNEILKAYERVIHPVKPLVREDGLAGFHVQLAYPWKWTPGTLRQIRHHGREWLDEAERDLTDRYERDVRGQGVDLDSHNKPEPSVSVWQRIYDADPYAD